MNAGGHPKDGVIGRRACGYQKNLGVLRFRLMVERGPYTASSIRRRNAAWTILRD